MDEVEKGGDNESEDDEEEDTWIFKRLIIIENMRMLMLTRLGVLVKPLMLWFLLL